TRTGIRGIKVVAASNVWIEHVLVTDFSDRGISDERTTGGKLFINDTTVRNSGQSGIVILPASGSTPIRAAMDHVRAEGNGNAGVVADNGSRVTISNSVANGNNGAGFFAEQSAGSTIMNIESSVSVNNGQGINSGPGASDVICSNVNIFNNAVGLNFGGAGGTIHSYTNNKVTGNAAGNGPFS